ncbi:MAG: hypothetical protein CMH57_15150 [Myxococcales bacterium]|nr:hypothetical protein [Myxococcales bacterium]
MDLIDLIQTRRFLGNEFLTWLWYKSEVFEGRFNIGKRGACEVWFDDSLTLEAVIVETERSKLKGASPSVSPEAREALRQGKLPTQARLRVVQDQQEYGFVFKAPEFALSSVRIPALLSDEEDEKFYERMYLIEEIESIIHDLYGEFLALRLSPTWDSTIVPWLRAWVMSEAGDVVAADQYRDALKTVKALESVRRFTTSPRPGSTPSDATAEDTAEDTADATAGDTAEAPADAAPATNGATTEAAATEAAAASGDAEAPAKEDAKDDAAGSVTDMAVSESGEPVIPPPPF